MDKAMDRRQRKTREAIFTAFTSLLETKSYNRITVGEIIEAADVGRATFYAHFETKDFLLKELCEELFDHILNTAVGHTHKNEHYDCDFPGDSVFLHLINHLMENDYNILSLLSSHSNEIFLQYFKTNLKKLIKSSFADTGKLKNTCLPEDFAVNHIAASFVETVSWWITNGMKESPKTLAKYFDFTVTAVL